VNFADRVSAAVTERESELVLGLDPDPSRLLPSAIEAAGAGSAAERAGRAVAAHCEALIAATAPACIAVKLQLACFERLGAPGWSALEAAAAAARDEGLLVIADGKRGDVPHTAGAYAQALTGETPTPWGAVRGLGADAITANPLLGRDALAPLVESARAAGGGVFVLVRTTNPGAAEIQDATEGGPPLRDRLALLVNELGAEGLGERGLSDVGAVVGATTPELIEGLRALMPSAPFLLPGIGAQGGGVDALGAAFAPGPGAALVTAARSIVGAALETGDPAAAAEAARELRDAARRVRG
jgi:orotidine-5'-phosphate decarboxylase